MYCIYNCCYYKNYSILLITIAFNNIFLSFSFLIIFENNYYNYLVKYCVFYYI